MARFRERFEVKNEMSDIKEVRPDDNQQTGGQSTVQSQEEIKKESNSVGFDDDNFSIEEESETLEEYRSANQQVEAELAQYYDDDITIEELRTYLTSKITEIYGKKMEKCNLLPDSVVDGFLDMNEFNGAESYKKLAQTVEESITTITKLQDKIKGKRTQETSVETGLDSLSEEETKTIMSSYKIMSMRGELSANAYLSSKAKQLGVDKKTLSAFIQEKGKAEISSPDKVLHYHRTSMKSFEQIMQTGFLLNRKNMQLNGIDTSNLRGSSSANIQFSRDVYDADGKLQISGFDMADNLGASSADVVFVMSPELMNEETYNCFTMYPTVEKADIQRCCATILAKDSNIQMQIESILRGKNLPIRTMLQEKFDREAILDELSKSDVSKQMEETGAILHSVNGKPIREEETAFTLISVNGKKIREEPETGIRLSSVNGKPLEQITALYRKTGVKQSDLQTAYSTISRTKNEREQSISHIQVQLNKDDFEGR